MSSWQYARYKARTENEANTFEARCARYFALETTPPDPGVELYATECPCDKLQPDAENQAAGCEFIPFEQLPPEMREAPRSTRDIVAHARDHGVDCHVSALRVEGMVGDVARGSHET